MTRLSLPVLLLAGISARWAPLAAEETEPRKWTGEPYRLTVCVRFSEDPIFTQFFTDSVLRQVGDQLANYFGSVADVETVSEHPLLARLDDGGFDRLDLTPDDFVRHQLDEKYFVLLVACRDGLYRIQWRQLDGSVHYVGPVYTRSTPDRHWLAKAICLAVKEYFAPVAVVTRRSDDTADLQFRGEALGRQIDSSLEEGCVLQPHCVVRQTDGSLRCTPIPNTFLVLQTREGKRRPTVVSNHPAPWKQTPRVVEFRAIELTTQPGRFRLRLVNANNGLPLLRGTVLANSRGFDSLTDSDRLASPDPEGYVVASRDFDRLAYISISPERDLAFRILLPITRDWCELECKLPADPHARRKDDWRRELRYCIQDVRVLQATLDQHIRRINDLNGNKRYEEAMAEASGVGDALADLARTVRTSVAEAEQLARVIGAEQDPMLAWVRQQIGDVERRIREVEELAGDLKQTVEEINARNRAQVHVKLAGQAEENGDIDEAIERYEVALAEWPDQPELREHLEKLREVWTIKSPEHQQARDFIDREYAAATIDQIEPLLPGAEDALRTLVGVGDYLTARRLAQINGQLLGELADRIESLSGPAGAEGGEQFQRLAERLADLQQQVLDFRKTGEQDREDRGAPAKQPSATESSEPKAEANDSTR